MARALEGRLEPRPFKGQNGEDSEESWAWVGRVAGRKQTLGRYPDMSEAEAKKQLAYMVEQVRRGVFTARQATPPPTPKPEPTPDLRSLATDFLADLKGRGTGKKQVADLEGLMTGYVLRHLRKADGTWPAPSELDVNAVEALRKALQKERAKLDELRASGVTHLADNGRPLPKGERSKHPLPKGLGDRRVNRALRTLYRVLDYAAPRYQTPKARDLRDAKLTVKVETREGPHLNCGQVLCLLEAARDQEETTDKRNAHVARVAPLGVLSLAGLRLGELCDLRMMDVLTTGSRWYLDIRESKTTAGVRKVPVVGYLRPILAAQLMRRRAEGAKPRSPLFTARTGKAIDPDNFRKRVWVRAAEAADKLCAERGLPPIPGIDEQAPEDETRATPHALRRSYITHMAELSTQPKKLMRWVGHKDAKVTIEIYERVEDRDEEDPLLPVLYGDEPPQDNVVLLPTARASSS
jgi:integrase